MFEIIRIIDGILLVGIVIAALSFDRLFAEAKRVNDNLKRSARYYEKKIEEHEIQPAQESDVELDAALARVDELLEKQDELKALIEQAS